MSPITTMSLITRRKIMGPRIDPCTTPHITGNTSLFTPPMLTYCVLPWRYDVNHGMLDTFTPYNRSFFINISCLYPATWNLESLSVISFSRGDTCWASRTFGDTCFGNTCLLLNEVVVLASSIFGLSIHPGPLRPNSSNL